MLYKPRYPAFWFQHTAARRRLVAQVVVTWIVFVVSTHSRPKAAGKTALYILMAFLFQHTAARRRLEPFLPTYHKRVSCFNTQPPEGGWDMTSLWEPKQIGFNTQPPEGGWLVNRVKTGLSGLSFNTQPPEGGWPFLPTYHKRVSCFNTQPPEGGWFSGHFSQTCISCFNTQPPEGGWLYSRSDSLFCSLFQHTAARRRLVRGQGRAETFLIVSTHSRPKAAGMLQLGMSDSEIVVSTHSRPKAAGFVQFDKFDVWGSFNTQPPEGGWVIFGAVLSRYVVSTHSRPKAAGSCCPTETPAFCVSTHSRPKAAGFGLVINSRITRCFNTQPPEGGWVILTADIYLTVKFQHTAARRRLDRSLKFIK